jgi:hypothetical protein
MKKIYLLFIFAIIINLESFSITKNEHWSIGYSLYSPWLKGNDGHGFSGLGGQLSFGKKYISEDINYNLECDLYIGPFSEIKNSTQNLDTHGFGIHLSASKNTDILNSKTHQLGFSSGIYVMYLRGVSPDYDNFENIKKLDNPHTINSYKITTRQLALPLGISYSYKKDYQPAPLTTIKSFDINFLAVVPLYSPYKVSYHEQTDVYKTKSSSGLLWGTSFILQFSTPFGA